jgi:hypothetical protein
MQISLSTSQIKDGPLEGLSTAQFATAAFYVDLLAERGPLVGEPAPPEKSSLQVKRCIGIR